MYTRDEHQVAYRSVESLHCASETNITLYANQMEVK